MKKNRLFWVVLVLTGLAFGGWYFAKGSFQKMSQTKELREVNVQLKWLHQTQFAGHYVADQKGYYKDNGIKVNLIPFDYEHFPVDEVAVGNAQFGVAGGDELLIARSKGAKVRALAVIYQDSPVVAYALTSSGIKEPKDMIGKVVGIEQGVNVEITIKAMIERQGIKYDKDIEIVPIGFDVSPILNGEVDVATGYETNEPIQVESAGYEVNIIAPHRYGIKMYGDVLFATEELIEDQPELVRDFVQATLKGWEYALDNPEEATEMTLLYDGVDNKELSYEHQWKLLDKSQNLIKPAKGIKIGVMSYSNWNRTYQLLREGELIEEDMDVTKSFTKEFLERNEVNN